MPKKKTRKAVAKRFKVSARGKVKHAKAGRGHLLGKKSRKRKMHLKKPGMLGKSDEARIRDML